MPIDILIKKMNIIYVDLLIPGSIQLDD